MKKILSVLLLGVFLVGVVSVVSADSCQIEVSSPSDGQYFSDNVPISWTADGCTSPTFNVHYKEGSCDVLPGTSWHEIADSLNSLELDGGWASSFDEGEFCVRVSENEGINFGLMTDTFYIDNINPVAEANGPYECSEGETVELSAESSYDPGVYPSGIGTYEWYVNGDLVYSGPESTYEYNCLDGDANLDVNLVVTDNVGNYDSDSSEIEVMNVDPVCEGIENVGDVPLVDGQATVDFSTSASDVSADEPLTYSWNFDDGSSLVNGDETSHIYYDSGMYNVEVLVTDKDGGSTTCTTTVDVVRPKVLDSQEVAAYYPLVADFGVDGTMRSFYTGLTDTTDCEIITAPENVRTKENLDVADSCRVRWDNDAPPSGGLSENPTNDEQGNHFVLIRAENEEGDYDYFSFDIMVYSWIIDLQKGWNLVSIPYVPLDSSVNADDVGISQIKDDLDSVWSYKYNAAKDKSKWRCVKTDGLGEWSTDYCTGADKKLTEIVPGRGYWIKMNHASKLKGFGTQIAQGNAPGMPPEVEVPTNSWSLIGRYGILGKNGEYEGEDCWDAGSLSKSTALESLTKLDNELHVFDVEADAHLNEVSRLFNNQGYWLWIEDEASNNVLSETYAPLDSHYTEDITCH